MQLHTLESSEGGINIQPSVWDTNGKPQKKIPGKGFQVVVGVLAILVLVFVGVVAVTTFETAHSLVRN